MTEWVSFGLPFPNAEGKWTEKALSSDKATAQKLLRAHAQEAELEAAGLKVFGATESLADIRQHYLDHRKATAKSERSYKVSEHCSQRFLDGMKAQGVTLVKQVTNAACRKMVNGWLNAGLSHNFINDLIAKGKAMLSMAQDDGLISINPLRGLKYLKVNRSNQARPRYRMNQEELQKLIAASWEDDRKHGGQPATPFLICLAYTGMRRGEAFQLQWEDYDGKSIRIRAEYTKTKTERVVPVHPELKAVIDNLDRGDGSFIFRRRQGGPHCKNSPGYLTSWMRRIVLASGIQVAKGEVIDLHAIRHSVCTILLSKQVDVATVASLLGHQNVQTTLKVYTDMNRLNKETAVAAL